MLELLMKSVKYVAKFIITEKPQKHRRRDQINRQTNRQTDRQANQKHICMKSVGGRFGQRTFWPNIKKYKKRTNIISCVFLSQNVQ